MNKGARPIQKDIRDCSFHKTFGIATPDVLLPDFSVDLGGLMPDQNADGRPFGCTGYAQDDLNKDENGTPSTAQAIYDKTLALEGNSGNYTMGCDIRDSLKVLCTDYGHGRYYNVEPLNGSWFDGIRSALWMNRAEKRAVSIGSPWLPLFENVGPDGIVLDWFLTPMQWNEGHNWVASGWKTINGEAYIVCKSWQGERFGDHGLLYFSRKAIEKLLAAPGCAAFTVSSSPAQIKTIEASLYEQVIVLLKKMIAILHG